MYGSSIRTDAGTSSLLVTASGNNMKKNNLGYYPSWKEGSIGCLKHTNCTINVLSFITQNILFIWEIDLSKTIAYSDGNSITRLCDWIVNTNKTWLRLLTHNA